MPGHNYNVLEELTVEVVLVA